MTRLIFHPDGDVLLKVQLPPVLVPNIRDDEDYTSSFHADWTTNEYGHFEGFFRFPGGDPFAGGDSVKHKPEVEPSYVEMLVSSKHLMLVSPVLNTMLQLHFAEGLAPQTDGFVTIPLDDHDKEALEVILNIIHCQSKKIPRYRSLAQLTQIAFMVDKYMLHDMISFHVQVWIEWFTTIITKGSTYGPRWQLGYTEHDEANEVNRRVVFEPEDTVRLEEWLGISWVFKSKALFEQITQFFIRFTKKEDMRVERHSALPVPTAVFEKIEATREEAILFAFRIIKQTLNRYKGNLPGIENRKAWKCLVQNAEQKQLMSIYIPPLRQNKVMYTDMARRIQKFATGPVCACPEPDQHINEDNQIVEDDLDIGEIKKTIGQAIEQHRDRIRGLDIDTVLSGL